MKRQLLFLPIILTFIPFFNLNAQSLYERQQGHYTLGINAGLAYQQSDVPLALRGFGLGLTLAKNLYYRPGAPLSFDIRGRLLYTRTYGLAGRPHTGILNNDALNGNRPNGLDYREQSGQAGFIYPNYLTHIGEGALEAVITFNRLRERTGVIFSLYGGIGLDWYKTFIDQRDNQGLYSGQYLDISPSFSKSEVKTQLRDFILDDDYETEADGFGDGSGKWKAMPALGFELGYQITPRFSMGIGHKVTFGRTDLLDGQQWEANNTGTGDNDIYHYTYLSLKWIIEPHRRSPKLSPPIIRVVEPVGSPFRTSDTYGNIRARIEGVRGREAVNLTVNGVDHDFNYFDEILTASFPLNKGRNEVRIHARNAAGQDQRSIILIYQEDAPGPSTVQPPTVTITRPGNSRIETGEAPYSVRAEILHTDNRRNVTVWVNGIRQSDFDFNPRTSEFNIFVDLRPGKNEIEIKAKNEAGSDRDEVSIFFEEPRQLRPRVRIISTGRPEPDPRNPRRCRTTVEASIQNVRSKRDVVFRVNGRSTSNFSFNSSRSSFRSTISLDAGQNDIAITAVNDAGRDEEKARIFCEGTPAISPPVVTLIQPERASQPTSKLRERVIARVENIDSKGDIKIWLNGISQNNFQYNSRRQEVVFDASLNTGRNTVIIQASNPAGRDEATVEFQYVEPIVRKKPPRVSISSPSNNSSFTNPGISVKGNIKNVSKKDDVSFFLNNQMVKNFSFDGKTGNFQANIELKAGNNSIRLKAKTRDGEDEASVSVTYRESKPPTVRISAPSNNSVVNAGEVDVRAIVKNITQKNQILFQVNQSRTSRFDFRGETITAVVELQEGTNEIKIRVQNDDGSDEASARVTYKSSIPAPEVKFIHPSTENGRTNKAALQVRVLAQNVEKKEDLAFFLNDKPVRDFTFNSGNSQLYATVQLDPGKNRLRVTAKTKGGEAAADRAITYENLVLPSRKPSIDIKSISRPTTNPFNPKVGSSKVIAVIKNAAKEDITFTLNGEAVTNFSFNASTGDFQASISLVQGENVIVIRAANRGGVAEKTETIDF